MQVFKSFDRPVEQKKTESSAPSPELKTKRVKEKREPLTPREVKSKIKQLEAEREADSPKISRSQKKAEVVKVDIEENGVLKPLQNDPSDPVTREKLKDILGNGGINFSSKEREVLSSILK